MKQGRRKRMAAVSALGLGALTWGTGFANAAQGSSAQASGAAQASGVTSASSSTTTSQGIARTVSYKKDGKFAGRREYAYYGYVRVQAVISNGQVSDVQVLEYPNDNGRSHYINSIALPYLIQEVVDAQTYKVDLISGATFTSVAFVKSLQEALKAAGG